MNIGDAAPEHEHGAGQPIERGPVRPTDELAAERVASFAEVEARQGEAIRLDERTGEIGSALMELYADEANTELLQPFVDGGQFPETAAEHLCQYELEQQADDPSFDVTAEDPRKLAFLLKKIGAQVSVEEQSDNKVERTTNYKNFLETCKNDPEWQKLDNLTKLSRFVGAPEVPETEKAKYQALLTIHGMATKPEDAVIVAARINQLDLSQPVPNTALFIETAILADQNLSDSFRDEVATKFDVPNPRIKTGGQVDNSLDARRENGEPLYTPEHPLVLGSGSAAYENPDGSRAVSVSVPGRGDREIPWQRNESADVISTKISLAKIWGRNEWSGQTDYFGEGIDIETHIMSQTDPEKLRAVQNVMNALFGGTRGFDAVIVQDNEADFLGWFNQFTATKGDAMQNDFDAETAIENRTNLGFHPNGDAQQIDYDVLREAAKYAKGQFGAGEPDYFAMQRYLNGLFPDRVPFTGENAEDNTSKPD